MEELLGKITEAMDEFKVDAKKCAEKGNALAGRRSRKKSLEIEEMFKEWRKVSVCDAGDTKQGDEV